MAHVLAVTNQKGGVGKTTTAISLGAALAEMGRRVLLVDIDPQANATSGLGIDRTQLASTVYDVVVLGRPIEEARVATAVGGLELVPSDVALAGSEVELVGMARRERRLQYALEGLGGHDDYILVDCPPSLGLLTVNGVVAARGVLVPIQCEYYALEGLGLLMHTVSALRRELNPGLEITAIILTQFDTRLLLAQQVAEEVGRRFPGQLLMPAVPRNVRLSEAPSHGMPITMYDPQSRGALAYRELAANLDRRLREERPLARAAP